MLADAEWKLVQEQQRENELEVKQNEQLLVISKQILELTREIHRISAQAIPPARTE